MNCSTDQLLGSLYHKTITAYYINYYKHLFQGAPHGKLIYLGLALYIYFQ